jgi:glutamine synthetase
MPDQAGMAELDALFKAATELRTIEVLIPDLNGILRGKRITREEAVELFESGIKTCGSTPLMSCKGETIPELGLGTIDGDPDMIILPVQGTAVPVPWLDARVGQLLVGMRRVNGEPSLYDPRNAVRRAMQPLTDMGLRAVIATELEFYLLADADTTAPKPLYPRVPGTSLRQDGLQYAMMEDLWDHHAFLEDMNETCRLQALPATTAHSEFAPGQFEINLRHVDDPVTACDHAVLLKRAIKGVARKHGIAATFMAKPFAEYAGSGLHIHISLYDAKGRNVFADPSATAVPPVSGMMRHAIGGLAHTMADCMAMFCPNANSYRRLRARSFVPLKPNWGYNHRSVSLRIPVSDARNLRIEHRVAGADANPYLVVACVLLGIHYGLANKCDPGKMVEEGTFLRDDEVTLPTRWNSALDLFDRSAIMKKYLDPEFCRIYSVCRHSEAEQFHAQVSNRDYEWYLRAL